MTSPVCVSTSEAVEESLSVVVPLQRRMVKDSEAAAAASAEMRGAVEQGLR